MPTYEYECKKCSYNFEVFQSMKDEPIKKCPKCGKQVRRLVSGGVGVIFKGSGFYVTDNNKAVSKGDAAAKGSDAPKGEVSSKGDTAAKGSDAPKGDVSSKGNGAAKGSGASKKGGTGKAKPAA